LLTIFIEIVFSLIELILVLMKYKS